MKLACFKNYYYRQYRNLKLLVNLSYSCSSRKLHTTLCSAASGSVVMGEIDPVQLELMKEPCIVVDDNDNAIGMDTKKNCHLFTNGRNGILHRAFSVFLFNSANKLLLQKRSKAKITFPGYFTNTCCSHPLHIPNEMELNDAIGVKRAAQRKLQDELGIPSEEIPLECFHYITRMHYCSPSNDEWGEHEIDYILFVKADVTVKENWNEVEEVCYVSQEEFPKFLENLKKKNIPITPWFRLIVDNFLFDWWKKLPTIENLKDHNTIHQMTDWK